MGEPEIDVIKPLVPYKIVKADASDDAWVEVRDGTKYFARRKSAAWCSGK